MADGQKKEFELDIHPRNFGGATTGLACMARGSKEQVYEYSPSLLNVKGISWEIGSDEVCRRVYVAIEFGEFMNLNDLFNSFDQAYRNHIPQSIRPEQNFLASRTKGQGRCRLPACRPALRDQSSHSHRRLNQCRLVRRSVD